MLLCRNSFQVLPENKKKEKTIMVIRQLKQTEYNFLCTSLSQSDFVRPLDASRTAVLQVNGVEYTLKIQPEHHYKVALLQAVRSVREDSGCPMELITKNHILSALLKVWLDQNRGVIQS